MAQRKEFELNLQQLGLGIADLLHDVANDGLVARLFVRYLFNSFPQLSCVTAGCKAAQREKDLCLAGEVGVERTAAAASLCGDILNTRSLKAIPRKDNLSGAQQLGTGALRLQRLLRERRDLLRSSASLLSIAAVCFCRDIF